MKVAKYYSTNADTISNNNEAFLNPNHTNFIFYDDLTSKEFGKEVQIRSVLENELRNGKTYKNRHKTRIEHKIPFVYIVVRGGCSTLKLLHSSRKKFPILLLTVNIHI